MLELPEVLTIAPQMEAALKGKTIETATSGNSPHKFMFCRPPGEELVEALPGKRVMDVTGDGKWIFIRLRPTYVLHIGDMGGRILYHEPDAKLPKKYQFLATFTDGSAMTVTVSLWAMLRLSTARSLGPRPYRDSGIGPLGDEFTLDCFKQLFEEYEKPEKNSIKAFLINRPRINGIGNGYLQDILFRAGIHPTRKVVDVTAAERRKLHQAIRKTLQEAVRRGGSEEERDFHNQPGGYARTLRAAAKGKPCPVCGTTIEKIQFLGGASYFCPKCQP